MEESDHPLERDRATFTAGTAREGDGTGQPVAGGQDPATHGDGNRDGGGQARAPRVRFRDRSRGRLAQSSPGEASSSTATAAPASPGDAPTRPVGATLAAYTVTPEQTSAAGVSRAPATARAARDRRRRGLFAAVLAAILLLFALSRLVGGSGSSAGAPVASPVATLPPAPTVAPFAVANGAPLTATAVLGVDAKLKGPREAVELPDGRIAVADTDNGRLAILDNKGKLVSSITNAAAPLQQPFALATGGHDLYVLDAARGAVERFDTDGHFVREIIHDPAQLQSARGMVINRSGRLYVANPRSNEIVALSPGGKVIARITAPLGDGPTQYNQPSDVAVGSDYSLYIYDNINMRIKKEKSSGFFIAQWPAPPSDTFHSVHVLPLADGRLLASDPGGSLLAYPAGGGTPTRYPLRVPGQPSAPLQPLGLSLTSAGDILVADGLGNRLLVVTLP